MGSHADIKIVVRYVEPMLEVFVNGQFIGNYENGVRGHDLLGKDLVTELLDRLRGPT